MRISIKCSAGGEWIYRAHPVCEDKQVEASGVTLAASVLSGDGSVIQDPKAPFDVRLIAGSVATETVFLIKPEGPNVSKDLEEIIISMSQEDLPPTPEKVVDLGTELFDASAISDAAATSK